MTRQHVWQLARVVDRLNIPVMVYGLRTDFLGKLFPASEELMAIADEMREVRTICHCGRKATMVVRLDAEAATWRGKGRRSRLAATRNMSRCAGATGTTR
jgi:thymidine kinase